MAGSIRSSTGSGLSLDLGCDRGKDTNMNYDCRYVLARPSIASSGAFWGILCCGDIHLLRKGEAQCQAVHREGRNRASDRHAIVNGHLILR